MPITLIRRFTESFCLAITAVICLRFPPRQRLSPDAAAANGDIFTFCRCTVVFTRCAEPLRHAIALGHDIRRIAMVAA
jgi:hypothetical protein